METEYLFAVPEIASWIEDYLRENVAALEEA